MRPNACIIEEYDEHKHTHTHTRQMYARGGHRVSLILLCVCKYIQFCTSLVALA